MAESQPKLQGMPLDDAELSILPSQVEETAELSSEAVPPSDTNEGNIPCKKAEGHTGAESEEPQESSDEKDPKSLEEDMKTMKCFQVWEMGLADYFSSDEEADTYSGFDSDIKVSPDSPDNDPAFQHLRDAIEISSNLITTVEVAEKYFDNVEDIDQQMEDEVTMHEDFRNMCTSLKEVIEEHLEDAYKLVDPQAAYSPQDAEMATMGARFDPTTVAIGQSPDPEDSGISSESTRFEPKDYTSRQASFDLDLMQADFASAFAERRDFARRPRSLELDFRATSLPFISGGLHTLSAAIRPAGVGPDAKATSLPFISGGLHMLPAASRPEGVGPDAKASSLPFISGGLHTLPAAIRPADAGLDTKATSLPSVSSGLRRLPDFYYTSLEIGSRTIDLPSMSVEVDAFAASAPQSTDSDPRDAEFAAAVDKFIPRASASRPTSLGLNVRLSDLFSTSAGLHTMSAERISGGDISADDIVGTRFAEMSRSRFTEHRYHGAESREFGAAKKKKRSRKTPEREKRRDKGKSKRSGDEPNSSSLEEKSRIQSESKEPDKPSSLKETSETQIESKEADKSSSLKEMSETQSKSKEAGQPSSLKEKSGSPSQSKEADKPRSSLKEESGTQSEARSTMLEPGSSRIKSTDKTPEPPKISIPGIGKIWSKITSKVPKAFERVSKALDYVPRRISRSIGRIHSGLETGSGRSDDAADSRVLEELGIAPVDVDTPDPDILGACDPDPNKKDRMSDADDSYEYPEFPKPTDEPGIPYGVPSYVRRDPNAEVFLSRSAEYYSTDASPNWSDQHTCRPDRKESKRSKKHSRKRSSKEHSRKWSSKEKIIDVYTRPPGAALRGTDRNPLGHEDYPTSNDCFVRCYACFVGGLKGPTRADYGMKEKKKPRDLEESREEVEKFRAQIRPIMAKLAMYMPVKPNSPFQELRTSHQGVHAPWNAMEVSRRIVRPLVAFHGISLHPPATDPIEAKSEEKRFEYHLSTSEKDKQRGLKDDSKIKSDTEPRKRKEEFEEMLEAEMAMEVMDPTDQQASRIPTADGRNLLTYRDVIKCMTYITNVMISPKRLAESLNKKDMKKNYDIFEKENVEKFDKMDKAVSSTMRLYRRLHIFLLMCRSMVVKKSDHSELYKSAPSLTYAAKADWHKWFSEALNHCIICIIVGRKMILSFWESLETFFDVKSDYKKLKHHFLYDKRDLYAVDSEN